mmetsp:Transcript_59952/g.134734  ORF Transcript_59952/g.134734 Transcript_59952/m.134734 type:complete len:329 (+) Transcript_59952:3-989(+)
MMDVIRVVRLVVLRIANKDGLICATLANYSTGVAAPRLQLPGRKIEGNISPEETLQKLLEEEFGPMLPHLRLLEAETTVDHEHSASYDLNTKYIKTVQMAVFEADVVFPEPTPDHVFKANSTATTTHHPSTRSIRWAMQTPSALAIYEVARNNPFSTETAQHAFAIEMMPAQDQILSQQPEDEARMVNVFKWVDAQDFSLISSSPHRHRDVEQAMLPWCNKLTPQVLTELLTWTARSVEDSSSPREAMPSTSRWTIQMVAEGEDEDDDDQSVDVHVSPPESVALPLESVGRADSPSTPPRSLSGVRLLDYAPQELFNMEGIVERVVEV